MMDGYAGHGEHYFDYNHGNAYKEPHHAPAYSPPKPAYDASETDERIVEAPNSFAKVLDWIFFILASWIIITFREKQNT